MGSFKSLAQVKASSSLYNVYLEIKVVLEHLFQSEYLRLVVYKSQHDDAHSVLKLCQRKELIENDIRYSVLFKLDDYSHAILVGLVAEVVKSLYALVSCKLAYALEQSLLTEHIWNFINDYAVSALYFLKVSTAAESYLALARCIGCADTCSAHDYAACREVRSLNMLHELYRSWEASADAVYNQLASRLTDTEQSDVESLFDDYKSRVHKELDTLFLASERRFLASQSGAAEPHKEIEELFETVASSSDMSLEELQKSWNSIFDSGLSQWDTYASQVLGSQVDWDKLTSSQPAGNEEEWNNAMAEFTDSRNEWFAELYSVIRDGKNALDGRASSFFSGMEETLENVRESFAQNAQLLQTRMDAVFAQFSTVKGIKDQAADRSRSLRETQMRKCRT